MKNLLKRLLNKDNDRDLNELLKGSAQGFLIRTLGILFVYSYMLIISNNYGASELGIFTITLTILNLFAIIPKFGFENALIRVVSELKAKGRHFEISRLFHQSFLFSLVIAITFGVSIYLSSSYVANNFFMKPELAKSLRVVAIALPFYVGLGLIAAYFRGHKKTVKFVLFNSALIALFFLILLLSLIWSEYEIELFYLYLIAIFIVFVIGLLIVLKETKPFFKSLHTDSLYDFKRLRQIAVPLLFANSFSMMMNWSDIIMLGIFKSESDVGIYTASFKLATLTSIVLFAVNSIVAPKFAELYSQGDINGLKRTVNLSSKLIFFTSVPILLVLWLFPKTILGLYGEEFTSGVTVLAILAFGQLINALCGSVGYLMQMIGYEKVYQRVLFIALILNILLNIAVIPRFGIIGAAVASIISLIFWNITLVLFLRKKEGITTIVSIRNL